MSQDYAPTSSEKSSEKLSPKVEQALRESDYVSPLFSIQEELRDREIEGYNELMDSLDLIDLETARVNLEELLKTPAISQSSLLENLTMIKTKLETLSRKSDRKGLRDHDESLIRLADAFSYLHAENETVTKIILNDINSNGVPASPELSQVLSELRGVLEEKEHDLRQLAEAVANLT